jgi:hypothetical protein
MGAGDIFSLSTENVMKNLHGRSHCCVSSRDAFECNCGIWRLAEGGSAV